MKYSISNDFKSLGGQQVVTLRLDGGPTLAFDSSKREPREAELDETTVVQLRNDGYTVTAVEAGSGSAEETD